MHVHQRTSQSVTQSPGVSGVGWSLRDQTWVSSGWTLKWQRLLCSYQVMPDSLRPHGLQHARLPCSSLSPGLCSNSCPLSWWCHPTISSSVRPHLLLPSIFPSIRVFFSESAVHVRWPKYRHLNFSISPSNEYSGLISFRIDWFDLLAFEELSRVQRKCAVCVSLYKFLLEISSFKIYFKNKYIF